jgi:hypothetical protein
MGGGVCIGGYDIRTNQSLRLSPPGRNAQPPDSKLEIGGIWEIRYSMRGSARPFVEDCDAEPSRYVRDADVEEYVDNALDIAQGDTDSLYDGMLRWQGHKGYIDPDDPSPYSTQFWRPSSFLQRYEDANNAGRSVFWEPETKRRILWVGAADPPDRIPAGDLCRVSLSRAFEGSMDHPVCWLQLSGTY